MLQMEPPRLRVSRQMFEALVSENPHARLERAGDGTLIVMPPAGMESSRRNIKIATQLENWNETAGLGFAFESSAGFELPDGAIRSADAAWVSRERYCLLTDAERETFAPICPDFVVELRSRSDPLADLRHKIAEYVQNGARLGWLIDPYAKRIEVYRPGREVEFLESPAAVSGEDVLPGFVLDLAPIFDA